MYRWKSFVYGALILLAVSVPSLTQASTVTSNTNVYNANSVGCDLIEAGRYEEAARYFMAALNQESTFAPAWLGLSVAFAGIKDYDTSIDCAKNAIKFCDGNEQFKSKAVGNLTASYYNRGDAYYDKGEFGKAIKDYSHALELWPTHVYAYCGRGNAYNDKGEYDKAITDYSRAIELDPKFTSAYNNRGNAYTSKGEYDKAIADYNRAIELDPKCTYAYNGRGNAYRHKGEYDRAIAEYNCALEIDSGCILVHYTRAIAFKCKGQFEQALADCEAYLRFDPEDQDAKQLRQEILDAMQRK